MIVSLYRTATNGHRRGGSERGCLGAHQLRAASRINQLGRDPRRRLASGTGANTILLAYAKTCVLSAAQLQAGGFIPDARPVLERAGSFALGSWQVNRIGYGAMQLAGDGVFGPPGDRDEALRVLRAAIDGGINHIDTAQYYGLGVVKELIHEAPYPYPAALALVSKVAVRHVSRKAAADACSSSAARSRPARMCCRTR